MDENYLDINRKTWNNKVAVHIDSAFYANEAFLNGKSTLNSIELDLLGDVSGKSVLHLQCHFGQDSLSLGRMGAQVTGIDFSDKAIEKAQEFNDLLGLNCRFVCCDVYQTRKHIVEQFDIVFSSYGTIGWLPDLQQWANVIANSLKPGGQLVFAEFHPVVWMFDNDFKGVFYSYFNVESIIEDESGTYADRYADIEAKTVSWNHSLAEVIEALLQNGLTIEHFGEYDYSPYACFRDTEEFESGKYRVQHLGNKIPMVYSIVAVKK